ncbi:MAG: family 10 glycosylhydrolase, partial [Microcystaceae cyanobacterium]
VMEVVNQYDVDGIQFDDHFALPNEFGYDPYTIALYQQEMKKAPPSDPKDSNWIRWRANKITAFVAQLNKAIKQRKPNILFSLSPATYRLAYNTYLQDWLDWVRKGLVDELIVQVYRTDLSSFMEPLQRPEFREAKSKVPTAVGILTGLKRKQIAMPFVSEKVRVATANGLGVSFFYYETLWDLAPEPPAQRQAEFRNLFPTPARRSLAQKFIPTVTMPVNPNVPQNPAPRFPPTSFPRDNFPPEPTLDNNFPPQPTAPVFQDNFPSEPTL